METVNLKEYFERILVEKDKAINSALATAKEAVLVAEKNAEKWRDNANEWRGAMTDREKTFATKVDLENLKERMDINKGKGMGLSQGWAILIGVTGFINIVIGIIITLTNIIK